MKRFILPVFLISILLSLISVSQADAALNSPPSVLPIRSNPISATVLTGEVRLKSPEKIVYNPDWDYPDLDVEFLNPEFADLKINEDYYVYVDWFYNGNVRIVIMGAGNYTGVLYLDVPFEKADQSLDLYEFTIPDNLTYSADSYSPYIYMCPTYYSFRFVSEDANMPRGEEDFLTLYGYGADISTLLEDGTREFKYAVWPGTYKIYLSSEGSDLYNPLPSTYIGDMTIYPVDEAQVSKLFELEKQLKDYGCVGLDWATYYTPLNRYYYSRYCEFYNGKVTSLELSDICNPDLQVKDDFPSALFSIPGVERITYGQNGLKADMASLAEAVKANPELLVNCKNLKELRLYGNRLTGEVGLFGQIFPNLKSLDISSNNFYQISAPLPYDGYNFYYGYQHTDYELNMDLSTFQPDSLLKIIPTLALYNPYNPLEPNNYLDIWISETDDRYYSHSHFGLGLSIWRDTSSGDFYLSNPYDIGSSPYQGPMETQLWLSVGSNYSGYDGIWIPANVKFIPYDTNFDFKVNVSDLQTTVNYILYPYFSLFNYTAADINADKKVDVRDIVLFINGMMGMAPQPFYSMEEMERRVAVRKKLKTVSDSEGAPDYSPARVSIENGGIYIDSPADIAALDLLVDSSESVIWTSALKDAGLVVTSRNEGNSHRIMAYSQDGVTLKSGRYKLADSYGNANLLGGSLADAEAREIPIISDFMTGLKDLGCPEIKAYTLGDKIVVEADEDFSWQIISISGMTLGKGDSCNNRTELPVRRDKSVPLIVVVSTSTGTKTFKL